MNIYFEFNTKIVFLNNGLKTLSLAAFQRIHKEFLLSVALLYLNWQSLLVVGKFMENPITRTVIYNESIANNEWIWVCFWQIVKYHFVSRSPRVWTRWSLFTCYHPNSKLINAKMLKFIELLRINLYSVCDNEKIDLRLKSALEVWGWLLIMKWSGRGFD